jgi:hypothetical protein
MDLVETTTLGDTAIMKVPWMISWGFDVANPSKFRFSEQGAD